MSDYLTGDYNQNKCMDYEINGVIIHSGDFNAKSGHYYSFIRPKDN